MTHLNKIFSFLIIQIFFVLYLHGQVENEMMKIIQPQYDFEFTYDEITDACKEMNYSVLENKLEWFKNSTDSLTHYYWRSHYEREITDKYIEEVIVMIQSIKTKAMSSNGEFEVFVMYYYVIDLIKDKTSSEIYYSKISKRNNEITLVEIPISEKIIGEFFNLDELDQLKLLFNEKYKFELLIDELFMQDIAYSFNCEIDKWIPRIRLEIDEAVEKNNQELILSFLRSTNIERQLYGIDGVYQLLNSNIDLQEEVSKLFESTKVKTGTALYCDGHQARQKPIMAILFYMKKWYVTMNERE